MKLNPAQKKAVMHEGSPALVLAGAGSGKTGVITRRIAWLIGERGVDPAAIAAVTFTNKAAREMKQRVGTLIGERAASSLQVSTFHRLGMRILKEECAYAGLERGFSIVDPSDARAIVADLIGREFSTDPAMADAVSSAISSIKNSGADSNHGTPVGAPIERICDAYQRHLRALNAVDLDDMIALPRDLLEREHAVLEKWRDRIRFLLVDEYQDTNAAQYRLITLLAGDGRGLMVVGDDDQSIYAWRGAMPENLGQLAEDFRDLTVIKLEQNYRSRGRILKIANQLIRNNARPFEKTLWSELGHGDPVRVTPCDNEIQEAERVVSELMSAHFQRRAGYADFAILYRSNHQARVLEQKLMEMQVPYRLSGGLSFFDRTEVRDLMAYLRLIANPADDRALLRIVNTPRRGIGAGTLEKIGAFARARRSTMAEAIHESDLDAAVGGRAGERLAAFAALLAKYQSWADQVSPRELIDDLLAEIGYRDWIADQSDSEEAAERRWQNVMDLAAWLQRVAAADPEENDLADAVRKLVLTDMLDRRDADAGGADEVSLMTLHAAKGLEFDHVFIVGLADDILPHANSQSAAGIEEERRLFYVGITRARKYLDLSFPRRRRRYGEIVDLQPSRFLDELPREDLDWREGAEDVEAGRQRGRAHLAGIRAMLTG